MTWLLPDEPIDNASQFGFDHYSAALVSIIKSKTLQTPFTIAIHGDWGSGKTSLMKTVAKKLESSSEAEIKVKAMWFNAWDFEKIQVPLWKVFLNRIMMELQEMVTDERLKSKIRSVGQGLLILSSDIILKKFVGIDVDELKKVKNEVWNEIERINSLREDFSEMLEKALKNDYLKRERFVIFIDDLDRCLPDRCVEIFESIKLFLNSEKCVFVIGINKDQIQNAFAIKFNERENSPSFHYMEKFVQLQFDLPRKTPEEIQSYLLNLSSEQLKKSPKTIELISRFIEPNPRKIKRWINSVLFLEELFRIKQQTELLKPKIDLSIVSIWLFLKSFFPDFSELIERDPSLFNDAINITKGFGTEEDKKKIGDFTIDKHLAEFLSILEPTFLETQLKEIVYLSKLTPIEHVSTLPTQMLERILEIPEEELIDQLRMLSTSDATLLIDKIIENLLLIQNYGDYDNNLKKFEMLNLIFNTSNYNSNKILLFEKIINFMDVSMYAHRYFSNKLKLYISSPIIEEHIIKEGCIDKIIDIFAESNSFNSAKRMSAILSHFNANLTSDNIKKIINVSLLNGQIYNSFGARNNLQVIFDLHKSEINDEEIEKIKELMDINI